MTLQPLHDSLLLELHPFSRCAIGLLGDLQVHQLKRILVFTDGSHDNQNSETDINNEWSMIVLAQDLDGHLAPFGGTSASYHQDASLLQSNGSISSGGAEAIAIAIAWASYGLSRLRRLTSLLRFTRIGCLALQARYADTDAPHSRHPLGHLCLSFSDRTYNVARFMSSCQGTLWSPVE